MLTTQTKREEQLKQVMQTLSEHVMDEQHYTQEERTELMDIVLQLLRLWRNRL